MDNGILSEAKEAFPMKNEEPFSFDLKGQLEGRIRKL